MNGAGPVHGLNRSHSEAVWAPNRSYSESIPKTAIPRGSRRSNSSSLGFQERRDIQEWVAANPGILGEDLLVIGKEFSGFDRTDERSRPSGRGRGWQARHHRAESATDTGADAHWQAIKYASYFHPRYRGQRDCSACLPSTKRCLKKRPWTSCCATSAQMIFNVLNNDQRIILASHRFAPEVTSAALWLNEKAPGEDLITCVQLTPYRDGEGRFFVCAGQHHNSRAGR